LACPAASSVVAAARAADDSREAAGAVDGVDGVDTADAVRTSDGAAVTETATADTADCALARCWPFVAKLFEAAGAASSEAAPSANGAPRAPTIAANKIAELM
jgi:hypothetical protein